MTSYTGDFYTKLRDGVERSADAMIPHLLEWTNAKSVVDLGCGSGHWLRRFKAHGVPTVLGLDGPWVTSHVLAEGEFVPADLSKPVSIGKRFDLAISLEVAEHLPANCAETFVESLVHLAPIVMFSAAIPQQSGVDHINEQWQDYWATLFARHGFVAIDAIRPLIWDNPGVEPWYAQNTLIYVNQQDLPQYPALGELSRQTVRGRLSVVHPRHYSTRLAVEGNVYVRLDPNRIDLSTLMRIAPTVLKNALVRRLRG